MLGFLVFLVYLVFFIPLILAGIAKMRGREVTIRKWGFGVWLALGGSVGLSLALWSLNIYTEVLWFNNLGYTSVFWKMFSWQWGLFLVFGAVCYIFLQLNALAIKKAAPAIPEDYKPDWLRNWRWRTTIAGLIKGVICLLIALLMGLWAKTQWNEILMYLNQVASGITDPIFQKDVSFYLFSLPVFKFVGSWLLLLLILTLMGGAVLYWFYYALTKETIGKDRAKELAKQAINYGSLIGIGIAAVLIWMTVLAIYSLLYSERGVVFGASYTAVHAQILAYQIFIGVLVVVAVMFLINAFIRGWKLAAYTCGGFVVAWFLVVVIYPAMVQQFVVKPNELDKETPYIKHNIAFTRQAYKIAEVEEKEFKVSTEITPETLRQNQATLDSIRLWDWRALKDTYRQTQTIRLYYEFSDVDIDRYMIHGQYRQVMLAVRELDKERLPEKSRTWINEKFKYTHGYGLCLNSVNEFVAGGLPNLLVKDIPPVSSVPELKVTRPEVYYGEKTVDHVFVKTTEKEFDYPKGDENIYCFYQGRGGVALGSWLRKFAFAWRFDGIRVLLAKHLKPESRVMFYRQIPERVKNIAPFLWYDQDPYIVIDENGRQWWIQDAYTVSENYPYSEPTTWLVEEKLYGVGGKEEYRYPTLNYIRNSVKVTIDPYNGQVDFYVFDQADPIIQTYQNIFPALFKPREEMPKDLQKHIRYPEDFFFIQAKMYGVYHMESPTVFYNREDQWEFANETYISNRQPVSPYYVILRLPGEKREEFILMVPFTPYTPPEKEKERKDNMIAWMAARCDGEQYGKTLVYKFGKEEMIAGPMQIESWIDQNTEMSEKLTLWGQKGSEVIRGNLLVIPVNNSLLYVEPLYLQAELGKMPQIKKITICRGVKGEVVWDDSFSGALEKIVAGVYPAHMMGGVYQPGIPKVGVPEVAVKVTLEDLVRSVTDHFRRYQSLTGEGKFNQAGQELEALRRDLEALLNQIERR